MSPFIVNCGAFAMKRPHPRSCVAFRALPWLTIAVILVWLLFEATISVSSVHGGETCMFDWDAYMEQVSKLMFQEHSPNVGSVLDSTGAVHIMDKGTGSGLSWNFNYTELKGDTGPLVYPALHTWIHSALFVVSGWDARRWTTETTPKNMSGYEDRTHRPAELLRHIQYGYVGLHMATLACVLGVMAAAGLLSPMGQDGASGAGGSAGKSTARISLLQRLAGGLLFFLRAQGPAVVTCALLSLSQRVRNTSVAGLFNDSWAMLLAHACVLALVHRRFLTGCLLLSAGVAVKMNVLLLAPGVLYVLLAEGGIVFAAKHIAACGVLQLLLAAPFLATAPIEYLRRAFDLGRKFDQQWSVNWHFLPAGLFGSGLFAAALLALQVSLLLAFALRLWRAQHLSISIGDAASGTLKPLKSIGSAATAAAIGVAGNDEADAVAGAVAPARTPTADPEGVSHDDDDDGSSVTPSAVSSSRLQHLRERPKAGGSTPASISASASSSSLSASAAARASPRDAEAIRSGSCSASGGDYSSSTAPAYPADRGRGAGLALAPKWSWARGATPPLTAQGIAFALYSSNLLGIACARSLHFQFFTWYFHSLPLLLRFTRWPWLAHVAFVVALEVGWSHHPPAGWSSALVTALHFALVAGLWLAGGRAAEADEADTASGARLLRAARVAVASTGLVSSGTARDAADASDAGLQLKVAANPPLSSGPAKAQGLSASSAGAAAAAAPQGLRINIAAAAASRSKPLQQLAELVLSPSPQPQSAALPAVRSTAAMIANRQRDL